MFSYVSHVHCVSLFIFRDTMAHVLVPCMLGFGYVVITNGLFPWYYHAAVSIRITSALVTRASSAGLMLPGSWCIYPHGVLVPVNVADKLTSCLADDDVFL